VEWAMRLPGTALLPPGAPSKFLLRQMCAQFYSPEQTTQAKRGFTLPLADWLQGPLAETRQVSLDALKESGLLAPQGIERVEQNFLREPRSAAWSRVWALVALGHWLKKTRSAASAAAAP